MPDHSIFGVQEKDLGSVDVLKVLNSIFGCGELPTLFSNDELDGLLQVKACRMYWSLFIGGEGEGGGGVILTCMCAVGREFLIICNCPKT